jgi:hypothetical protein
MRKQSSTYRGWKLAVVPGRVVLGHGVRARPPHRIVMAKGWGEELVLDDLRRQIDAIEDAGDGEASVTRCP